MPDLSPVAPAPILPPTAWSCPCGATRSLSPAEDPLAVPKDADGGAAKCGRCGNRIIKEKQTP